MRKIPFYRHLKGFSIKNLFTFNNFLTQFNIFIGTVLIATSIHFVFTPTNLITGGISGIGIIIEKNTRLPISYFVLASNVILLIVSYFTLGKEYFLKTIYTSILLPLILKVFELIDPNGTFLLDYIKFGALQNEVQKFIQLFFAIIIGAIFSGVGMGIVLSQNASTGGMDIIQRLLNKKLKIPFSLAIYSTDGLVVLSSILIPLKEFENSVPLKIITLLFSGICIYLIGLFVDKYLFRGKLTYTCFIITSNIKDLRIKILSSMQRSFTKVSARGGYSNDNKEMLIVTVRKHEIYILIEIIKKYDPQAFSFVVETKDVVGYGFKDKLE